MQYLKTSGTGAIGHGGAAAAAAAVAVVVRTCE